MSRVDEISANLEKVNEQIKLAAASANRLSEDITLVAVTKTFPVSDIEILYSLGIRDFGENRDQEASEKVGLLPKDVRWHFQGQIQSNKLKSITSWASYIHSVDQLRYAQMISDYSAGNKKPIFMQVSLDKLPQSRSGVNPSELLELAGAISALPGIRLQGLMAVAPVNSPAEQAFAELEDIRSDFLSTFPDAKSLSIGMSGDYQIAIKYGATHIRIGSSILGIRSPIA
jgi:pyridoxal phosphate enzyme (YggS family)